MTYPHHINWALLFKTFIEFTIAFSRNWHTVKEVNKRKLEFVSVLCYRIIQYNELNYFKSMAIYSQDGVKKGFDGNLVAFKEKQR